MAFLIFHFIFWILTSPEGGEVRRRQCRLQRDESEAAEDPSRPEGSQMLGLHGEIRIREEMSRDGELRSVVCRLPSCFAFLQLQLSG